MLRAASRVPDHKKLVPSRFILFHGEARTELGKILAEVCRAEEKDPGAFRLENEAKRFLRAPIVIAAVSRVVNNPAAPQWSRCFRPRRLPEPDPRLHCAGLWRAMDHRVVRL